MNLSTTNIAIVIAIIIVGLGGYWYFSGSAEQPPLSGTVPSAQQAQFLTLSSQLTNISFDTSVLSDPRFTALVDMRTPIATENVGRVDPFAPIGK